VYQAELTNYCLHKYKICKNTVKIFFFFISCSISNFQYAQDVEMGLNGGVSNYLGDLAPEITISENHPYFSLFIKKNMSQFFSISFSASQAHISGNDQNFNYLANRNLSFETNIFEISTQLEFNFFPFAFGLGHKSFTPYVFTGLSAFKFDPYVSYNGSIVKLNQLDTEAKVASGDKKHVYTTIQLALPIGGGFKYKLSDRWNIGINLSYRYCFTDYLDDVSTEYADKMLLLSKKSLLAVEMSDRSEDLIGKAGKQRGRSDIKDWYIFSGISVSYKIKNKVCFTF